MGALLTMAIIVVACWGLGFLFQWIAAQIAGRWGAALVAVAELVIVAALLWKWAQLLSGMHADGDPDVGGPEVVIFVGAVLFLGLMVVSGLAQWAQLRVRRPGPN